MAVAFARRARARLRRIAFVSAAQQRLEHSPAPAAINSRFIDGCRAAALAMPTCSAVSNMVRCLTLKCWTVEERTWRSAVGVDCRPPPTSWRTARTRRFRTFPSSARNGVHDRAERLERGLGRPVGRGARVQHRAQAGRDIDDPAPPQADHLWYDGIRERQRRRCVDRDKYAMADGRRCEGYGSGGYARVRSVCCINSGDWRLAPWLLVK